MSTEPEKVEQPAPPKQDDLVTRFIKAVTFTRAVWLFGTVILMITIGAVNRVIGEGEARAYFEARYVDQEKRLSLVEVVQKEEYSRTMLVISKLSSLEGSLAMLALILRDRHDDHKEQTP